MRGKTLKYVPRSSELFILKQMAETKANGYIKKGAFSDEIIWGAYSYVFSAQTKTKQKVFQKGLFLFGMVRKDARAYLKNNPKIKLPKRYAQIQYNDHKTSEDLTGTIAGTDLNHAYWRIAYNLGIISEYTYAKGLPEEFKSIRLAALSTMGTKKKYQKIVKGKITDEFIVKDGEESLLDIYKLIRYTCYQYMAKVKRMLGSDFLAYKTDCIYYINTKENKKLVVKFFKENDLLMKQLS